MIAAVETIVKAFFMFTMSIVSLFSPLTKTKQENISRAEDNCRMSFAAMSDTHMTTSIFRKQILDLGFADFDKADDRLDAVLMDGDITDDGTSDEWEAMSEVFKSHDIADSLIIAIGNHDTRGWDDYELVRENFSKYNKELGNRDEEKVYYSTNIKGYPVIVLGSEHDGTAATISDEQVEWFREEMEKAAETGLPIFVFLHQPINQTHGLPYTWEMNKDHPPEKGGIGDKSDEIEAIIKQYKNVFYISGHIHAGLSTEDDGTVYSSVEKHDGYTLINLPSFMYLDVQRGGHIMNGTGYVIETYDDHVLLRARNYITGTWLTKYDVRVDLI